MTFASPQLLSKPFLKPISPIPNILKLFMELFQYNILHTSWNNKEPSWYSSSISACGLCINYDSWHKLYSKNICLFCFKAELCVHKNSVEVAYMQRLNMNGVFWLLLTPYFCSVTYLLTLELCTPLISLFQMTRLAKLDQHCSFPDDITSTPLG